MRRLPACFALLLLLSACKVPVALPTIAKKVVVATKTTASAEPTPTPSPAAPLSSAAPSFLKQAAGAGALAGRVALDPAYVTQVKSGHLISQDGGGVLAAGDGVVSNDGGSLISQDGGGIVAQGGGNVIVPAALIGQDGGGLLSQDGGGVVSNDGGSIVAQGGGNLVTKGAGTLRLLDVACAAATTDDGLPPTAGMAVWVRSLKTGKPIPVGVDEHGKPAYAIYTNLKGEYQIFLPASLDENVEVRALMPRHSDPRLQVTTLLARASGASASYHALAADTAGVDVDNDTAVVAEYIVSAFGRVSEQIVAGNTEGAMAAISFGADGYPGLEASIRTVIDGYCKIARDKGYDKLTREQRLPLAVRLSERVIASARLDAAVVDRDSLAQSTGLDLCDTKAIPVLVDLMRNRRVAMQHYIDKYGYDTAMKNLDNCEVVKRFPAPGTDRTFEFRENSDFGRFVAENIVASGVANFDQIGTAIVSFEQQTGIEPQPGGLYWFLAALGSVLTNIGATLVADTDVQQDLATMLNAGIPTAKP